MLCFSLILVLCFSSMVSAQAGLLQKTVKNAVLHIPWEDKTISWDFSLKNWGTWNISSVSVNKQYLSAPSGTDWEYVYLAMPTTATSLEWMGGNHNNEQLKTLQFIIDGQVVKNGIFKVENSLVIIETTNLVYPTGKLIVGSVERRYEINVASPNRINFWQKTTWFMDMYVERAYMCMLPIYKKHGRHFEMGEVKDSFVDNVRTNLNKGYQQVTETYLYGDNGWGMIAGINDLSAVDNYDYAKSGAFVWDLANDHVKLYYPRAYEMGLRFVPNETVWSSGSYFIVVKTN